jgi:hypothetical protein
MIVLFVLRRLSSFEKFKTHTKEAVARMRKLFWALFINVGILIVIVNANLMSVGFFEQLKGNLPIGNNLFFNGSYYDTVRMWYVKVGVPIILLMMANLFSYSMAPILLEPVMKCYRCMKKNSLILQADLNALYQGREFDIPYAYAKTLSFIFICFMYAGGLPILLPILSGYLFIQYYADKYMCKLAIIISIVLRHYKKPLKYNVHMHNRMMSLLPFAFYFHVLLSLWFYGTPSIYDSNYDGNTSIFNNKFFDRVSSKFLSF